MGLDEVMSMGTYDGIGAFIGRDMREMIPHKQPNQLAPWSWTSRLQNHKKYISVSKGTQSMVFCYSSLS